MRQCTTDNLCPGEATQLHLDRWYCNHHAAMQRRGQVSCVYCQAVGVKVYNGADLCQRHFLDAVASRERTMLTGEG